MLCWVANSRQREGENLATKATLYCTGDHLLQARLPQSLQLQAHSFQQLRGDPALASERAISREMSQELSQCGRRENWTYGQRVCPAKVPSCLDGVSWSSQPTQGFGQRAPLRNMKAH